ncbi:MAG: hypothetical protein K6U04_08755 [Armatimonadetes bacterium]|nr:hypothetical protein [Armatimonadota bacterium]
MREITDDYYLAKRLFCAALEEIPGENNPEIEGPAITKEDQVFQSILLALENKGYHVEVSLYPSWEDENVFETEVGGIYHDGRIWINSQLEVKEQSVALVHEVAHALHEAAGGKGELIPYLAGAVACYIMGILNFKEAADEVYKGCFMTLRDELGWVPARRNAIILMRCLWGKAENFDRATQIAEGIIRLVKNGYWAAA